MPDMGVGTGLAIMGGSQLAGGLLGGMKGGGKMVSGMGQIPPINIETDMGRAIRVSHRGSGADIEVKGVSPIHKNLDQIVGQINALRDEVTPGFGRFTEAAVTALNSARDAARGNLREQLERRRVRGASFANAQEASLESEFGQKENQLRAAATLEEIGVTARLIEQEFGVYTAAAQDELATLGLGTQHAAALAGVAQRAAALEAQLAAQSAAGEGAGKASMFGNLGNLAMMASLAGKGTPAPFADSLGLNGVAVAGNPGPWMNPDLLDMNSLLLRGGSFTI